MNPNITIEKANVYSLNCRGSKMTLKLVEVAGETMWEMSTINASVRAWRNGYASPKYFSSLEAVEAKYKSWVGVSRFVGEKGFVTLNPSDNPYFGRRHLASRAEPGFVYKDALQYTLDEWVANVFINPWENVCDPDGISFVDKRLPYLLSKMTMRMAVEDIRLLRADKNKCKQILVEFFQTMHSTNSPAQCHMH